MDFFVFNRRAGATVLHVTGRPPIYNWSASLPRDRMYTLCGYRIKGWHNPNSIAVDVDGVLFPRVVPKSPQDLCKKCLDIAGEHDLMKAATTARVTCEERRLGMFGYNARDGYNGWWLLWTRIAGIYL